MIKKSHRKGNPGYDYEQQRKYKIKYRGKGGPGYEHMREYAKKYYNKGGLGHAHKLEYERTGLQGEKRCVRRRYQQRWSKYKNIIAPGSEIHHEWIPGTADYRGVALVEADKHHHGIIDVILILEGEITLVSGL